jgi:hypothetical protein
MATFRLFVAFACTLAFNSVASALPATSAPAIATCEFEATVTADGFVSIGCWGPDEPMTCVPSDPEHPFQGWVGGTFSWPSPSR